MTRTIFPASVGRNWYKLLLKRISLRGLIFQAFLQANKTTFKGLHFTDAFSVYSSPHTLPDYFIDIKRKYIETEKKKYIETVIETKLVP